MRKAEAAEIIARRLSLSHRRILHLVDRLAEVGLFTKTEGSRRFPPHLSDPEIVRMFLAAVTDNGLGRCVGAVRAASNLRDTFGARFEDVLFEIFGGGEPLANIASGFLLIRSEPAGVTLVTGGEHSLFGAQPPEEGAVRSLAVPGRVVAAIGLELLGHSVSDADAIVAMARVANLGVSAFERKVL